MFDDKEKKAIDKVCLDTLKHSIVCYVLDCWSREVDHRLIQHVNDYVEKGGSLKDLLNRHDNGLVDKIMDGYVARREETA